VVVGDNDDMMPDADAVSDRDRRARVQVEGSGEVAPLADADVSHHLAGPFDVDLALDARARPDAHSREPVAIRPQPTECQARNERDQQPDEQEPRAQSSQLPAQEANQARRTLRWRDSLIG
jgi:hypothetical protein